MSWATVDGTRVLRIGISPFAAQPEPGHINWWIIFHIPTRATCGYVRGNQDDVRTKLLEKDRELIAQQKGN